MAYQHGVEIGRTRYEDDGHTLRSDINLAGTQFSVAVQREPRRAHVEHGGQGVDRDVTPDTIVLENGDWQAYAIAAEWFASSTEARDITVLLPGQNARVPGRLTVAPSADHAGGRSVHVQIATTEVHAEIDSNGAVVRVEIPSQGIEVLPEGVEAQRPAARVAPAGVTEEPVEVERGGVALRGVLWRPSNASGPTPVVLFIAGSGPTDRDCNQQPSLRTDTYRWMAEALAQRGIASLRYDKRGVGASGRNFAMADTTIEDFVADATALIEHLRADPRTASITVAGHSEGGLIAIMAAGRTHVDALALLATAGRPFGALIREQLARQLDAHGVAEVDGAFADIRAGNPIGGVSAPLRVLFNPTVARFLQSVLDIDPAQLLHALHLPTVIVQGETDAQVTVADARLLAAARPDARLVVLPRTNHLFKEEAAATLPQASYTNPDLPVVPAAIEALVSAVPQPTAVVPGHRHRH